MDADEQQANETIRVLIHLRDTLEDVHMSEVLDELIKALKAGGDHPLLHRWVEENG